jgi:phosphopantetheine adenylyltransferase
VDIGAGPGSVDVRIVLVDHDPSRKYSTNFDGEYETNCTTVLDLAAFASKVYPWTSVFYPSTEAGYALFKAYLDIASTKSSLNYEQLVAVDGGITMIDEDSTISEPNEAKLRGIVCLGGTFDHLHPGHKLLLHATVLLLAVPEKGSGKTCTLIVGISGDELLVNKKYAEQLQSWDERARNVLSFLSTLLEYNTNAETPPAVSKPDELVATLRDGTVKVRCVNIHDPFGPTITEEDMDVIVVSAETRGGGKAINDKRTEKAWKPLEVYEIDVLDAREIVENQDDQGETKIEDFSAKISSTTIREQRATANNNS